MKIWLKWSSKDYFYFIPFTSSKDYHWTIGSCIYLIWKRILILLSFKTFQKLMRSVLVGFVCFARSPAYPGSHRILDMTECLQWARYHWQRLMGSRNRDDDERPYNYSSLLACGGKSSQTPKLAGKHRVVVPHLRPFKDEYEKFSGTYVNNRIRTTKYTLLNFVPRNLFEQFHRYFYFFEKKKKNLSISFVVHPYVQLT